MAKTGCGGPAARSRGRRAGAAPHTPPTSARTPSTTSSTAIAASCSPKLRVRNCSSAAPHHPGEPVRHAPGTTNASAGQRHARVPRGHPLRHPRAGAHRHGVASGRRTRGQLTRTRTPRLENRSPSARCAGPLRPWLSATASVADRQSPAPPSPRRSLAPWTTTSSRDARPGDIATRNALAGAGSRVPRCDSATRHAGRSP
jgi:hypothetical protein